MQVLLLATDEQKRLAPLADALAAPMVPIVNRPVMAIMLEIVARAGYKQLLVSLHQRGGSIAAYFGAGRRWGAQIEYVMQREAWGDAGALRWAARLVRETILVLPADAVLDLDIAAALAAHQAAGAQLTLVTARDPQRAAARPLAADANGRVLASGSTSAAFTGAFLCEPAVLEAIPARTRFDVYADLVPALLAAGAPVQAYATDGYWNPLDSFPAYHEAQRVFLYSAYQPAEGAPQLPTVRYPSIEGHQIAPGIWVGVNHMIHPTARLAAPICIGEGCRIGYGADLGPEAVLGAGVIVDDEATVQASTILSRTYVGSLVNVQNRLVRHTTMIDLATSEHTTVVDKFLLADISPTIVPKRRLARAADLLVSGVLLIVLLPLLLLVALVALLASGQLLSRTTQVGRRRVGRQAGPESFTMVAFQSVRADGTISRLGRWLRGSELDRLPQLWNVLKGDLALVGVKPLAPSEAADLQEAWHQKRNEHSAGFTGLWYVQAPADADLDAVLIADAYYATTYGARGNLAILGRTPIVWARRVAGRIARRFGRPEFLEHVDTVSSL